MSDPKFNLPKMPEFRATKNGYEIRADILAQAKDMVQSEYSMKFHGWEITADKDTNSGQIITKVAMPEFPGLDKILETAERMYAFVNQSSAAKK